MGKIQKATRLPKDQADRVERYADQHDISEADALRRLIRAGLEEEEQLATDGGYITLSDNPWIDPLISISERFSLYGTVLLLLAVTVPFVPALSLELFGVMPSTETIALFFSAAVLLGVPGVAMSIISVAGLVVLEYLMHPREAPFRRHFPSTWPDHETNQKEASA